MKLLLLALVVSLYAKAEIKVEEFTPQGEAKNVC
jgi:hypothetical protein